MTQFLLSCTTCATRMPHRDEIAECSPKPMWNLLSHDLTSYDLTSHDLTKANLG